MGFTLPVALMQTGVGGAVSTPPAFIASEFTILGSGNSLLTVDKPPGTQSGDTMVFFYWGRNSTSQITTPSAGWTQDVSFSPTLDATTHWAYLFHLVAGGAEPASYDWSLGGGNGEKAGVILTYRPAHGTQLEVTGFSNPSANNSASHPQTSMTTSFANARLVYGWMLNRSGALTLNLGGWTDPSGMIQRYKDNYSTVSRPDVGLAIYDEVQVSAGATGSRTLLTADNDVSSVGIRCAIRAA